MQIAHIDHDHSNSTEDNLVALCLQHHDAYDTTPRQTKKLTKAEVRTYRQSLYDLLEKKSRLVQASFLGPEGKRTTSATNAHRLGQIVEAFDEDMGRVEPNGARLSSLAIRFAVDEGDFTAARQAEIELMRVIEASKTDAPWFSDYRERDNPECDPVSMLLRASSFIGQLDWRHAFGIVHLAAWRAFLGDGESYKGLSICDVPCPRVRSYAAYLIAVTSNEPYPFSPRVREFALDELENLACRVTAAVAIQGIELPETPGHMSKTRRLARLGDGARE